jgi:hypothetical protein
MANYVAVIEDTKWPLAYIKWIEGKRIDSINRAILATGKAWPELDLPTSIKPGHGFRAAFDGWRISIDKY